MNIPILYEDEDLLVINKPAGITVNRAETTRHETTVQDWAERKLKFANLELRTKNQEQAGNDFYNRGGVVHRLDKETSGVLILAKNPESFTELQSQFKEREVKKVYIALAHRKISPAEGEINVPVGRLPWNRNRFGILPGGRESKTLYKVLRYYSSSGAEQSREVKNNNSSRQARTINNNEILTLLELYPQSGRTHQIRVHLKYIGNPIFSDFLYAGRKIAKKDRKILDRVFLHAAAISFQHPKTKKIMSFDSPLPENLKELLKSLQKVI